MLLPSQIYREARRRAYGLPAYPQIGGLDGSFGIYYLSPEETNSQGLGARRHQDFGGATDELKRQKKILFEANNPKKSIQSKQNSFLDDDEALAHAIKLSIAQEEAEKNYLRFYASRIIIRNPNEEN